MKIIDSLDDSDKEQQELIELALTRNPDALYKICDHHVDEEEEDFFSVEDAIDKGLSKSKEDLNSYHVRILHTLPEELKYHIVLRTGSKSKLDYEDIRWLLAQLIGDGKHGIGKWTKKQINIEYVNIFKDIENAPYQSRIARTLEDWIDINNRINELGIETEFIKDSSYIYEPGLWGFIIAPDFAAAKKKVSELPFRYKDESFSPFEDENILEVDDFLNIFAQKINEPPELISDDDFLKIISQKVNKPELISDDGKDKKDSSIAAMLLSILVNIEEVLTQEELEILNRVRDDLFSLSEKLKNRLNGN